MNVSLSYIIFLDVTPQVTWYCGKAKNAWSIYEKSHIIILSFSFWQKARTITIRNYDVCFCSLILPTSVEESQLIFNLNIRQQFSGGERGCRAKTVPPQPLLCRVESNWLNIIKFKNLSQERVLRNWNWKIKIIKKIHVTVARMKCNKK
jgi:hypothetical protein